MGRGVDVLSQGTVREAQGVEGPERVSETGGWEREGPGLSQRDEKVPSSLLCPPPPEQTLNIHS